MRVFRLEYTILAGMLIIQCIASFASPLGIKQLLELVILQIKKIMRVTFGADILNLVEQVLPSDLGSGYFGCS